MQNDKQLGFMFDIESLDTGPLSVVTQVAFVAWDLLDPDTIVKKVEVYLPIQPQLDLGRTISGDTIIWWMGQNDQARMGFIESSGNDMEEFRAGMREIARKLNEVRTWVQDANVDTEDKPTGIEIWARGQQFDITNIESLMAQAGVKVPWQYSQVRDLRTLMATADLDSATAKEITDGRGLTFESHIAVDDCLFQLECLKEANRRIRLTGTGSAKEAVGAGPSILAIPANATFRIGDPKLPLQAVATAGVG